MYYPPTPGYPPHMPPPPPPPPPQLSQAPPQQQMQPPIQQQYRPPLSQRQSAPIRQQAPISRPQIQRQPVPRQSGVQIRQRSIAPRPRVPMTNVRGPRPRMPVANAQPVQNSQQRMVKRNAEQMPPLQSKRKKVDVLLPDKNEDPDCQVVCTQPKNTGLPQIQSVQVCG